MPEPLVEVELDLSPIDDLVRRAVAAIVDATAEVAKELHAEHIAAEAPRASGALATDWSAEQVDPLTWVVKPGPTAWYAHIVAGGTRPHGPATARAMTIGDRFVAAVSGVPADPFHERAVAAAERTADAVLQRALAAQGVL